ncbi:MAG TPA: DUF4126 family protein [Blastocatellia bacterium]|nr:DUF4126 family protein [Blastocatellia bacterium]
MDANNVFLLALGIGIVAGLRALTAPAAVSWAGYLGWLDLKASPLAFMSSIVAVALFTLAALAEYVNDQLPKTPSRTAPPQLITRLVTGGLSGAGLYAASGQPLWTGALVGAVGAIIGTFGGYQARSRLVRGLQVKDIFIAIPEDLIAIGLAIFLVSR